MNILTLLADVPESKSFIEQPISMVEFLIDITIVMILMCLLVYLTFTIVKKTQIEENHLGSQEIEQKKVHQKIDTKNQIEIIRNGIVCSNQDNYIIPAKNNAGSHIFDESYLKVRHDDNLKPIDLSIINTHSKRILSDD